MRVIRTLPTQEAAPGTYREPSRGEVDWSPLQGTFFVSGVLIALVGLLGAAYCVWILSQIDASPPPPEFEAQLLESFDKLPVNTMYEEVYLVAKKEGLGERILPMHMELQRLQDAFVNYLIAACVAIGVGVVLTGASFVLKGRKS